MRRLLARTTTVGRVMIVATVAVAVALVFTRTLVVLFAAVVVILFWAFVVISSDPMMRYRTGDNPGVSEQDRWRDTDL